ncbi:hypothetical protein GCM10028778_16950 [Barrientosiimonas marina]|uniref:5,10-methylene-tetrahydrofolate dehydrogenase n=1 Tax=Lentibacillus kimchii TaxID=1542911 RepID=A0ABW2UXN6_9BACI
MTQTIKIGLIAAPELAERLAHDLARTLPDTLTSALSREAEWEVETVVDSLTGAAETAGEIISEAAGYRQTKDWDYIISLTDLPVFHNKYIVAVDIDEDRDVSLISIPAYGWMPVLKQIQKTVLHNVQHMLSADERERAVPGSRVLQRQFPISPVRKMRARLEETGNRHTRYIFTPQVNGTIRLLSGMTFANNPFSMMTSLTKVIAIAFTTGSFGMIFTTMWQLSHLFSSWRLVIVTFAAIFGMVLWIIMANDLWERPSTRSQKRIRRLYNLTTVLTLVIAVSIYYAVLFLLFLVTSLVFIPPDFLGETLSLKTSAGMVQYLRIAWFASSISTVAGAIGAGLENEALVRNTTYGYRQKHRWQQTH